MIKKMLIMVLIVGAPHVLGTGDFSWKEDILPGIGGEAGYRSEGGKRPTYGGGVVTSEQDETPEPFMCECIEPTRTCCGNIDGIDATCMGVILVFFFAIKKSLQILLLS